MKNTDNEELLDIIRKLVDAEEEEALRIFHGRAFGPKIKALVQAEEINRRSSPWRRIPMAAWTGAAFLAVAGIIALIIFIPRPSRPSPIKTLENFLTLTPGARTLLDRTAATLNGTETRPSPFESAILKVLGSSSRMTAPGAPGKSEKFPLLAGPKIRRLGLEKTYQILMEEKSIERVLASLKKIKEV